MCPRRIPDDNLSELGYTLERWRKEQKISQAVLGKMVGISQRRVSDWCKKEGVPGSVIQFVRLATLMGTSAEALLEKEANLAPLRDVEFVRDLIARLMTPDLVRKYERELERKGVRLASSEPRSEPGESL